MLIPGFIISLATFPGVIVHEAAHQLMCRLTSTPVLQVCYFRIGNPSGFVNHEIASTHWKSFWISVAPFLINTILGFFVALPTALATAAKSEIGFIEGVLGWLGISIVMHAFPSTGDAKSLTQSMSESSAPLVLRIIGYPVVGLIYVGSVLSMFWFDAIYAALICFALPHAVLTAFV